jgi:hypothetical protein
LPSDFVTGQVFTVLIGVISGRFLLLKMRDEILKNKISWYPLFVVPKVGVYGMRDIVICTVILDIN